MQGMMKKGSLKKVGCMTPHQQMLVHPPILAKYPFARHHKLPLKGRRVALRWAHTPCQHGVHLKDLVIRDKQIVVFAVHMPHERQWQEPYVAVKHHLHKK